MSILYETKPVALWWGWAVTDGMVVGTANQQPVVGSGAD
jgi:hypothetical protein